MKLQGGGSKRTAIAAGLACIVTLGLAGCGVGHKGMLGQAAVIPHDGGTASVGTTGGEGAPPASDAGSPAPTGGGASGRGGNGGGGASGRGGMSGHAGGGGIGDASVAPDAAVDASRPEAGVGDAGDAAVPVLSACATSLGRHRVAPLVSAVVATCDGALRTDAPLQIPTVVATQSYSRCGTVGPETAWRVKLSPDARRLAALTSTGIVHLFDTETWREIAKLGAPVGALDAIAFSGDSTLLATTASEMGVVFVWSAADGNRVARYDGRPTPTVGNPLSALAYSDDSQWLATSVGLVIDRGTGRSRTIDGVETAQLPPAPNPALNGSTGRSVGAFQFVGCDGRVLEDGYDAAGMSGWVRSVWLRDPFAGHSVALAGGLYADISRAVPSPDTRWVALTARNGNGQDQLLRLFDAAGATLIASDVGTGVLPVGFSPAGDRLITTTATEIQVRSVPSLQIVARLPQPARMSAVGVSPRGEIIASDGTSSAWIDPATGNIKRIAPFPIVDPSFSADGLYGVSAGQSGVLFHLWREGETVERCGPAAPPPGTAMAGMALSADGATLATVTADGVVELRGTADADLLGSPTALIPTRAQAYAGNTPVAVANGGARVAVQGWPSSIPPPAQNPLASRVVVVERASGRTLMSRDVSAATPRLRLSGDGKWVAFVGTTSGGNTPTVLSVDGEAADLPFGVGYGQIDSFSADGASFAIETGAGIELWDLATATHETTWGLTGFGISGATLSPDWSLAVGTVWPASMPSASDQRVLTIWRPKDGTTVAILGTSLDVGARPIFDPSAAIVAGNRRGMHTLSTDWNAWQVWSADTGAVLRVFASSSDPADPLLPFAGGARLLTRLGSAFALWCR